MDRKVLFPQMIYQATQRLQQLQKSLAEEVASVEDAQLLLARCLRDNGYEITDPKIGESLRSVLQPVFLAADQKGRDELFETIETCAEENNIPLGGRAEFENPEAVARLIGHSIRVCSMFTRKWDRDRRPKC